MQTFEAQIYASQVILGVPENFKGVEVHGVRSVGEKDANGKQEVQIDDTNPEFVSTYVRHVDGRLLAVADFGSHAEASSYGRQLAAQYKDHGWTFDCPLTL